LLGFARFGIRAARKTDGRIRLILRIGFLRINLWKRLGKEKEKPKKPKKKRELPVASEDLPSISIPVLRSLRRGIRIDRLRLNLTVAGEEDPCAAAQLYGRLHMGWGILYPLLSENLRIKKPRVVLGLDFELDKTRWEGDIAVTISLGRIIAVLFAALGALARQRKRKAVLN
jgi:hypothetical protein